MNEKLYLAIKAQLGRNRIKHDQPTIAFDLDETIWDFVPIDSDEEPRPFWDRIAVVNQLYSEGYIIAIFTSRPEKERLMTINTLKNFNVKYHSIEFDKMKFDVLVDDKTINPYDY